MMFRMKKAFYGGYKSTEDIFSDFFEECDGTIRTGDEAPPDDFPENSQIVFAHKDGSGYEESCVVLYLKHGKLWYNSANHCSCMGFEGQWYPDEVTWFQLFQQLETFYDDDEAQKAWDQLVGHNCTIPVNIVGEDESGITVSRDIKGMSEQELFVLVPNTLITSTPKETE
jgi:hypothetical protein